MAAERSKIRLNEFVAKVIPDPNNAGELLLMNGFLGKSSEEDHTRIYWDASLNSYVDVKDGDIVYTESLPKEASPLGGSYVWVKRDAKVYFGAGGQSTKGKFFEGPLMNAYGGQFAGVATPFYATRTIGCAESRICVGSIPCGSVHCIESAVCGSVGCPPPVTPGCTNGCTINCTYPHICPQVAAGGVAAFAQSQFCTAYVPGVGGNPSLVCSYAAGCWFSWEACPSLFGGCGGGGGRSYRFCPTI